MEKGSCIKFSFLKISVMEKKKRKGNVFKKFKLIEKN